MVIIGAWMWIFIMEEIMFDFDSDSTVGQASK